jgi:hypothetical protein
MPHILPHHVAPYIHHVLISYQDSNSILAYQFLYQLSESLLVPVPLDTDLWVDNRKEHGARPILTDARISCTTSSEALLTIGGSDGVDEPCPIILLTLLTWYCFLNNVEDPLMKFPDIKYHSIDSKRMWLADEENGGVCHSLINQTKWYIEPA